jgi:hypothetical protein
MTLTGSILHSCVTMTAQSVMANVGFYALSSAIGETKALTQAKCIV